EGRFCTYVAHCDRRGGSKTPAEWLKKCVQMAHCSRFLHQMPQFLCDEIQDYLKQLYGVESNDRIFPITKSYLHREMDRGCKQTGVKRIRIHDLRHPYVKHTTKKYNSEKQKTQATKMDLIAWVFRFCTFSYSKRSWTL